jgi:mRNA-degrading endonuclease YafQ of YafQ-DinJ toxin-antitoxin module
MFIAKQTPYFLKKAKKLIKKNLNLAKEVDKCIQKLQRDPRDPSLKSHKVQTSDFDIVYSSRVNGDLRIIWNYSENEIFVLDLLDIGGHSGKNKVYK